MNALLLVTPAQSGTSANGYIIGGIVAVLIMGYLFYVLFKPEKF